MYGVSFFGVDANPSLVEVTKASLVYGCGEAFSRERPLTSELLGEEVASLFHSKRQPPDGAGLRAP